MGRKSLRQCKTKGTPHYWTIQESRLARTLKILGANLSPKGKYVS